MIKIAGQDIPTELSELIEPEKTALIIIDMQNDFLHRDGSSSKRGKDVSTMRSVIPAISNLADAARDSDVLVVYTRNVRSHKEGQIIESPAGLFHLWKLHNSANVSNLLEGSWGAEIIDELAPKAVDQVINKRRSSAFFGTHLDTLLRGSGVSTIIVTGVVTQGCVMATVRDAGFHDYFVVVPTDCVASGDRARHDAAVLIMSRGYEMTDSSQIIARWGKNKKEIASAGLLLRSGGYASIETNASTT